jgi:predicted Kef-type K+ transport protein
MGVPLMLVALAALTLVFIVGQIASRRAKPLVGTWVSFCV